MRQFFTIAVNAFMELIRQPIFLLLMTGSVLFEIFLAVPYYFAFGDEPKLVENSVLAVMLLSGLFGAVLSASSSLAREIRSGTALAVLSKPVGRTQFLLAKFAGLAVALTVLTYVNLIGVLLASRMAFDAYGKTDLPALGIFGAGVALSYALAGFSNFFLRRPFVSDAVFAMLIFTTLAAFIVFQFTQQMQSVGTVAQVNWNLLPAGILILFALWILAAVALACSTRFDTIPTLAICSAIFLVGLDVGLLLWPSRRGRLVVGVGALHRRPELAAFLARRCAGHGQKHIPMGLRRQGVCLCGWLRGRGAGGGHNAV